MQYHTETENGHVIRVIELTALEIETLTKLDASPTGRAVIQPVGRFGDGRREIYVVKPRGSQHNAAMFTGDDA